MCFGVATSCATTSCYKVISILWVLVRSTAIMPSGIRIHSSALRLAEGKQAGLPLGVLDTPRRIAYSGWTTVLKCKINFLFSYY